MKNKDYKNFYEVLSMDIDKDILVVDPFAINMEDVHVIGIKRILRVRRPFWGKGCLSKYINKVSPEDLQKVLEDIENDCMEEGR